MSAQNASSRDQNARSNDENRPMQTDRFAGVRDPGATPRRSLKNDNVAVVHSSDLDSEPNTEMYEAYEGDDDRQEDNQPEDISPRRSTAPREGGKEEAHKTIP
jgi:hypothetical protein